MRCETWPLTVRHRHSLQTRELEAAVLECLLIALGTSFVMCIREGCYGQSGDVYAVQHETFACGLVLGHSHRYFHKVCVAFSVVAVRAPTHERHSIYRAYIHD